MASEDGDNGHQLVAGSGTSEGFSREGSDVDVRHAHPTREQDVAQALLGGLVASAANSNGNGHHHHHKAAGGMSDQQYKSRGGGGGGGQQDLPVSSGNRKGHREEHSMMGAVSDLWTRARRRLKSSLSSFARQHQELALKQKQRSRQLSSNFDFLVDAEEGVGLLAIGAAADGCGQNGGKPANCGDGPLHRSQSAIFVPARPFVQLADTCASVMASGTPSAAATADEVGELVDVKAAAEYLRDVSAETSQAGEPAKGGEGLSMKRGGRAGLTTGDLERLYREEQVGQKQGAGEDSAQDDDRQRPRATSKTREQAQGRRSFRWVLRPARRATKASSMPQLKDRKRQVEEWKRDREQWDDGFKVLGVEIGHLPENKQVAVLAGGVFFFLLIYGYMQEYLVVKVFEREFGLFMTFLQFIGYAACAALRRGIHRETGRKIPMRIYFGLGGLQAVMQGLTNVSMMYLNYPAKVLFKSSRMIPIMCFGVVWQGRRHSLRDCGVVCLIVTGLATFMNAEARSSDSDTPTSLLGVACISLALVIDAANINIQEEVMNTYASCQDELIMFSYLWGTIYVAAFCMFSGELLPGFVFLHGRGLRAIVAVMLYCGAGFLGGSCAVALTKRFGALHSAITTTARKAVTLMLSFVYFQKSFTSMHLVGATVFMTGLLIKVCGKSSTSESSPGQADDGEDSDQPTSSSDMLLPGSSGGGGIGGVSGSTQTQSPSPIGREGSPAQMGNTGIHPVRHRTGGGERDGDNWGGSGSSRGGRWVRKNRTPPKSPRHARATSPPVTGLGYMIA